MMKRIKITILRINHQARTQVHAPSPSHLHSEISLHWAGDFTPAAPQISPVPIEPLISSLTTSRPRAKVSWISSDRSLLWRKGECPVNQGKNDHNLFPIKFQSRHSTYTHFFQFLSFVYVCMIYLPCDSFAINMNITTKMAMETKGKVAVIFMLKFLT